MSSPFWHSQASTPAPCPTCVAFARAGAFSPHCTPLQHSLQTSSQQLVARTLRSVQLRASSGEVGPKKPKRGAKPPPETISNNGAPVSLASRGDDMLEEHDEDQDQFLVGRLLPHPSSGVTQTPWVCVHLQRPLAVAQHMSAGDRLHRNHAGKHSHTQFQTRDV